MTSPPPIPFPGAAPHRNLGADTNPYGPDVHQLGDGPDSFRWLRDELGVRGLAGLLQRGTGLVHCSRIDEDGYVPPRDEHDDNGPATISPITPEGLVARLVSNYLIWKLGGSKDAPRRVEVLFPLGVVRIALAALDEAPNLRQLRGVTHTPMVRRDGTILGTPGYDDATGFLYLPTVDVASVPERPTTQQTAEAVTFVRGLFAEFTWAGEHDEANYLGLLLTPLLRELCPGPYKMGAVMARQPGSGKSLLMRVLRELHGGVFRSEMPSDDAELEKAIVSILTATTSPVVTFDNVTGILRSSRLAGLLTARTYSGRVLGSTNNVDMVNDRLWTITGNNLALGGDLVRRTLWVTIDPRVPNPEQRTGFTIPDLPGYVVEHRGAILHALLVLVRAWITAGSPLELRSSDDYARWSGVVRGILRNAGIPGEFDHLGSRQQDVAAGDDDWREFLEAVRGEFGDRHWTVKELLAKVHDGREGPFGGLVDEYSPKHPIPLDALPAELVEKVTRGRSGVGIITKSLGMWLRNREGRWAGDLTVRRGEKVRDGVPWVVESFQAGGRHGCR